MSESHGDGGDGFVAFFGRYARTRYHTIATAAVTVFGTLTFVDRLFAVVAVASYVLPPIALYVTNPSLGRDEGTTADAADRDPAPAATRASGAESADGGAVGAAAPADTGEHPDADTNAAPAGADDDAETEPGAGADAGSDPEPEWRRVDAPTDETLADAAVAGGRAYAVGDGGSLLAGGPNAEGDGDGWRVVVADGPAAESNALTGVAATDGGVWFAGDNGAVGRFDPGTGRHVDLSAPDGDTTNLAGVAAAGGGDEETVLLVDGSGRARRGRYRDGEVTWDDPVTPGSGSSMSGVTLADESTGYLCDTNASVFALADRGAAFDRIGLDSADGTLTGVAAAGAGPLACADDGVVHRYDGTTWTPERPGDDPLWALAADGDALLAGADGGTVYERAAGATDWERVATPVTDALRGVAIGDGYAVAVGDDGAVVERRFAPSGDP